MIMRDSGRFGPSFPNNRTPSYIRTVLTREEVSTVCPLARFVGEAYRKAGGEIRQDLFSKNDEGFVLDIELLNRLAGERPVKAKARVEQEGCAWVDVKPNLPYDELAEFGRVDTGHVARVLDIAR